MSCPEAIGLAPCGGPHLEPEDFLRLLIRFQGEGAYADDESSLRVRELRAVALIASIAACSIDRAGEQGFIDAVTEMLPEWEQLFALANDAARSDEERRQRLQVIASSARGASSDRVLAILSAFGIEATLVRGQSGFATIVLQGQEREQALQGAIVVDESVVQTGKLYKALLSVLSRVQPARGIGQVDAKGVDRMVATESGQPSAPDWADPAFHFGKCFIRSSDLANNPRYPARVRSYGFASRIDADDFNRWQDGVLWDPGAGSVLSDMTEVGGNFIVVDVSVSSGATVDLDTSIDWRDRFMSIVGRFSTSDIRPGEASEGSFNVANELYGIGYTGLGGSVAYPTPLRDKAGATVSLSVFADATDGRLRIQNTTGSLQRVVLFINSSPDLGQR